MVQSTTKPACCSAVTTGASRWITSLAPVERIGTIWLMSRDRRAEGKVEYVRTTPGHWLATVYVDAKDEGDGTTKVAVRYRYTALSEEGNAYVRAMDDNRFAATIAEWEAAIRAALAR